MAKKDKDAENNLNNGEDSAGSKLVTALIVLVIVVIWLFIFGVLIKLNVGNFGSDVLYPVLKDVPVLNWILPEVEGDETAEKSGEYDNLTEANARIKELENQLATTKNSGEANGDEIEELKAEVKRLQKFEQNQNDFAKRVKEFDENVVYNDKAPDVEEYKTYYEGINPDNAEEIYREVCKKYEYSQEVKDQADMYGKMEPERAAAILEEMTNDLSLVASILDSMQASKSAAILQNMNATTAAQVTTKMTAMKK